MLDNHLKVWYNGRPLDARAGPNFILYHLDRNLSSKKSKKNKKIFFPERG